MPRGPWQQNPAGFMCRWLQSQIHLSTTSWMTMDMLPSLSQKSLTVRSLLPLMLRAQGWAQPHLWAELPLTWLGWMRRGETCGASEWGRCCWWGIMPGCPAAPAVPGRSSWVLVCLLRVRPMLLLFHLLSACNSAYFSCSMWKFWRPVQIAASVVLTVKKERGREMTPFFRRGS